MAKVGVSSDDTLRASVCWAAFWASTRSSPACRCHVDEGPGYLLPFSTCPTNVFLIFQALSLRIWGKGSGQASVIKFGSSNRLFQSICHISSHNISYNVISCHLCAHYLPRSIMPRLMFYHCWSDLSLFCQVLEFFMFFSNSSNMLRTETLRFQWDFWNDVCVSSAAWNFSVIDVSISFNSFSSSNGQISLDVAARILVELVAWTKLKASQQASTSKGLRTAGIAGHIFWSFWFFLHVWVQANSLKHVETTQWHHHSELRITGGPVDWVRDSLLRLFLLLHPHNLAPTKCKAERKCFLPGSMIWNDLKAWIISRKKMNIFLWTSWCFPNSSSTACLDSVTYSPLACGTRTCSRPRRENMGNVANPPSKSTSYGRHYCNIS